jgi:hypothetical protein
LPRRDGLARTTKSAGAPPIFDPAINPRVFGNWRHCLAFGFGSGLARFAPGTFGTLIAIPPYVCMAHLPAWMYAVIVFGAFAFGVRVCETVSRDLGVHDHGGIVFDEFVGYWTTMFLLPVKIQTWFPFPIQVYLNSRDPGRRCGVASVHGPSATIRRAAGPQPDRND